MLRTKIKAGPITNLTDARYFAAREVTWLGFECSEGMSNYLPPAQILAIRDWVSGVQIVGSFGLEHPEHICRTVEFLRLDAVQLSMVTPPETLSALPPELPVIQEIVIEPSTSSTMLQQQLAQYSKRAQWFLLDFTKNDITWKHLKTSILQQEHLRDICRSYPILMQIDLDIAYIKDMLKMLPEAGWCVKGGVEEKTGYKSFEEMDEILEILEAPEQF